MNIVSIDKTRRFRGKWMIEDPSFWWLPTDNLNEYVVQKGEDMRIDLIMQSIYEDIDVLAHSDVILYINGIDNPLNIREGMVLYFPEMDALSNYRYEEEINHDITKNIKERLGYPNKTTRKDSNRKKFLDADYSLPPVVLKESRPGVVITPTQILVGGIN